MIIKSTIYLVKNNVYHARTKHIEVKLHFIKDVISVGEIKLEKVSIEVNLYDMKTRLCQMSSFDIV